MANRIDLTFRRLKQARQKALIGYVTAGFPTKASLSKLVPLLEKSGMDLLELGVPFSDPIADGPTIQRASQIALTNGVTLDWVLRSVKDLRRKGVQFPLILMSYCNPILALGVKTFFQKAASSGVDGLIIPDMIPEEAGPYARAARQTGVHLIFLVSPTTPAGRIAMIANRTRGFLYAVSVTGVTGARKSLSHDVPAFLKSVKTNCHKPLAVGFGLSTPDQVKSISRYADAVIVGSALIKAIERSKKSSFQGAARFARSLKGALYAT